MAVIDWREADVKYEVQFQSAKLGLRPQGCARLSYEFESDAGTPHWLPNVGDAVLIEGSKDDPERASGVVRSRTFIYPTAGGVTWCLVNVVVEEREDLDWGLLIKE
jgi:hypothetical protein